MDADTREALERLRRDLLDAVRTSGAEIRRDVAATEARMGDRLEATETRMVEGIAAAEARVGERLGATEARMVGGIAAAEARMGDRLVAVEARMVEGIAAAEGRMGERLEATEARMVGGIAAAEARMGERLEASARETRRHFDVVAEGIRADVRMVAEGVVMVDQKVDGLRAETIDRFDRVDRRLLTLELRVSVLERR